MNRHIVLECCKQCMLVVIAGAGLIATALAAPAASVASIAISVFDGQYVVADRAFDDLDALERQVTATNFRSVELVVCGAKATRALKAALHRFRHVPVQIRLPDIDDRVCMSKALLATPVRQRTGPAPFGIDDEAVGRYWLTLMP